MVLESLFLGHSRSYIFNSMCSTGSDLGIWMFPLGWLLDDLGLTVVVFW